MNGKNDHMAGSILLNMNSTKYMETSSVYKMQKKPKLSSEMCMPGRKQKN